LDKFVYSLGINHVGEETAFVLAKKFSSKGGPASGWKKLENIGKATLEELTSVPNIGPIVAQSIFDWFQRSYNKNLLKKFEKAGIEILIERVSAKSEKLAGKIFVLTGTLETLGRDEAKDRIRKLGGDVSSSVSKETDHVVVGAEPGSKYEKAKRLKINILTEKEFIAMLK